MGQAKVTGFQIGDTTINIDGADGKTLTEVCRELDCRFEGSSFFINGDRVTQAELSTAKVKAGDSVRIAPKGDGGC